MQKSKLNFSLAAAKLPALRYIYNMKLFPFCYTLKIVVFVLGHLLHIEPGKSNEIDGDGVSNQHLIYLALVWSLFSINKTFAINTSISICHCTEILIAIVLLRVVSALMYLFDRA